MKILITLFIFISVSALAGESFYDCASPRPEMAGSHNMVLFGDPKDELYVYHLPLFSGQVHGHSGHVLMHVYQGIWNVSLDEETMDAYALKFLEKKTKANPIPFFSINPQGERFKVPQMICNKGFETEVLAAYGHVEGNPNFPARDPLLKNKLSSLKVKGAPVFARRFDGASKESLTYILFGTAKQYYAAHFLTDDENSFDQIVSVSIAGEAVKNLIKEKGTVLMEVPKSLNANLVELDESSSLLKENNKFSLPVSPLGQSLSIEVEGVAAKIQVSGLVYFNKNGDLKVSK